MTCRWNAGTVTALIVAPLTAVATHSLDDVANDNTFHEDIAWLAGNDVTRGCNPPFNDRYCPDEDVTRGEMAAMLSRATAGTYRGTLVTVTHGTTGYTYLRVLGDDESRDDDAPRDRPAWVLDLLSNHRGNLESRERKTHR